MVLPDNPDNPSSYEGEEHSMHKDECSPSVHQHYLSIIDRFNELSLPESSKRIVDSFFSALKASGGLSRPEDLVLLDTVCDDLLRIKSLQQSVWKDGVLVKREWYGPDGSLHESMMPNPAVELLHRAETQLRNNLKALALTRSEARKFGNKGSDPLSALIDVGEE